MNEHCWHYSGEFYATIPPKHAQFCCRCGEYRCEVADFDMTGHGDHLPKSFGSVTPRYYRWKYIGGKGPCQPQKSE